MGGSAYLLVEINHERALLGGWVQHSGAPAGRSRGSALLYREVCWSGRQLLGGEALILGRRAGQGALAAGAAPQRGGPSSTDEGRSFTEHGRSQRSTTHWGRKTAQGPGPTAPGPCVQPRLTAPTPVAPGSIGLGGSLLPSPELARAAAGSCRESPLTPRGRGCPPSHCQSPWLHQGWQRAGGAGPGHTTLGGKPTKGLRHREVQSLAPRGVREGASNFCTLVPEAHSCPPATPLCSPGSTALWHWGSGWTDQREAWPAGSPEGWLTCFQARWPWCKAPSRWVFREPCRGARIYKYDLQVVGFLRGLQLPPFYLLGSRRTAFLPLLIYERF